MSGRAILGSGAVVLALGFLASSASAFDPGDNISAPFPKAGVVSEEALGAERARGFPEELFGDVAVTNNTITAGPAGTNSISDSFLGGGGGMNCVCTVMQNTGNSAVMQHATIIQMVDSPQ